MKKIEEKIRNAAEKFAEQEAEIGEIDRDALYKGFYHGAKWALSHQWVSVEVQLPPLGKKVLCGTTNGRTFISAYDDCKDVKGNHLGYYWRCNGKAEQSIVAWLPIPPLPEKRKDGKE